MRWQPTSELKRVIVWRIEPIGRKWFWRANARNGRALAMSLENFATREQAARVAVMFGAPAIVAKFNKVTALHDGVVLPLNWSHPA